jgi:hypothetical protein
MNDFQEHALRMSLIPKRPSQQPERPLAYPQRMMIQPSVPPPISIGTTEPSVQPLVHPVHSSIHGDEVDNRFLLSDLATVQCEALRPQEFLEMATVKHEALRPQEFLEMATVKHEALRPQEFLVRRRVANSYPAVVSVRRSAKSSFLARAASLLK